MGCPRLESRIFSFFHKYSYTFRAANDGLRAAGEGEGTKIKFGFSIFLYSNSASTTSITYNGRFLIPFTDRLQPFFNLQVRQRAEPIIRTLFPIKSRTSNNTDLQFAFLEIDAEHIT